MGNEKGKWIQFEDGLLQSEVLENRLARINMSSYSKFREMCVNEKLAEKRRAILIFLGTNSGKRKKGKRIDIDEHSTEKLLIESIMDSCTRSKEGKGEFLTAAVVRCEDEDIKNAAYIGRKEIEEKKNNTRIDLAKEVLDKGSRIVDDRKISLGEKYVLIDKDIRETTKNYIKKCFLIVRGILVQYWLLIISALHFITVYMQEKIVKPHEFGLMLFSIIYCVICGFFKYVIEKAGEEVRKEIRYYRSLDYPVIFYNGTGKTKRWMRNYIQKYVEGEEEEKTKESVFFIGVDDSKSEAGKIYRFIIPKEHPEWGLICLCKLVRDLADNPWGEIWPRTTVIDKFKEKSVFSLSQEADKEQKNSNSHLRIFKMPKDEKELREEIEKKKNWHFARDPSSEDPESRVFPIGNSVYAIRRNMSWSDFEGEVIKLQRKIIPGINVFAVPIDYEKECELIERPLWDNDLWSDIWQSIIQLIERIESFQNVKINELYEIVRDEKKDKYLIGFVDYVETLENILKEKVDKSKSNQEELIKQKTIDRSNVL